MALRDLIRLVPPPDQPFDSVGNWHAAEFLIESEFPPDFKELIGNYGSGNFFHRHLTVFNPLTIEGLAGIKEVSDIHRGHFVHGWTLQLSVHPNRGGPGILFWGRDKHGRGYGWLTLGKPERWPVVYVGHDAGELPVLFRMTVTKFLAGFAVNEFPEPIMEGDGIAEHTRVFTPMERKAPPAPDRIRKKRKG